MLSDVSPRARKNGQSRWNAWLATTSVSGMLLGVMLLNGCSAANPSSTDSAPFRTPPTATEHRSLKLPGALPAGEVNDSYITTLSVNRGRAPYTFSISWGALPPGLTLGQASGTISGTPTKTGTFGFAVHVTDSAGDGGAQAYNLVIAAKGAVSVTVSPAMTTIPSQATVQLTATVSGTTISGVTWVATQGTVSSSGLYQAPNVSVNTVATVTATSVADPTKSASAVVTVTGTNQDSVVVSVSPATVSIPSQGTTQLTATVTGTTDPSVTWTATKGTVSTSGLYQAPAVSAKTVATVIATSVADPTKWASALVTITASGQGSVSVSVTPSTATVASQGTVQFTAAVSGTSNVGVTWTTTQGTITSGGLYTAPSVNTNTIATVTATSAADSAKSASASVTITASEIGSTADYYVAPTGSDSNPGTADKPFATVAKAQSMVRTNLLPNHCSNRTTPIVVQLRGGLYTQQSLSFSSSDSGCSAMVPVIYENYPGETPILSGGRQITGWTNITGKSICAGNTDCWQTTLASGTPYFEALFYNGQRRTRPRLGATASNLMGQYYRVKTRLQTCGGGTCYDRFGYNTSDPINSKWSNLSSPYPTGDIELVDFEKWTTPIERISYIDPSAGVIYLTGNTAQSSDHGYLVGHRYIVENIKDLLQFAGQWFLDRSQTPWVLTYLGNPGENPNTDTVIVPQNSQVLSAKGLQWVNFEGIQFEHDNYVVPNSGYPSVQLDPAIPAMVHCSSCQNVVFDSNRFTESIGVGLDVVGTSINVTVSNNLFYDLGAYGLRFGTSAGPSDTDSNVPQSLVATDNGIASVGRFLPSSDGIVLGDVHDVELSFNEVYDTYHDGFEICRPSAGVCNGSSNSGGAFNLNIHDNSVHNVMQGVTDDGGCYYAMTAITGGSASGNKFIHNECHDVSDASTQDSDGYGGHGIYLDSYTGAWDVEQNLIYRVSAVAFNMTEGPQTNGLSNTFANNVAAYARQAVVGVLGCPNGLPFLQFTFANNLVYQDRSRSSKPGTGLQKASEYFAGSAPSLTQKFSSNLYWNSNESLASDPHAFYSNTSSNCSGQNWMTFSQWQQFGEDSGSAVENPVFTNPKYPADDYSLASGSAGTTAGFVPFSMTFGRTNPLAIPSVAGTFPIDTYNPATDF